MQVEGQHAVCLQTVMATGARVSNAYPTCPFPRHSPWKRGLMPDVVVRRHQVTTKGVYRKGMGVRPISWTAGQRPTVATIGRGPERGVPHIGTETRPKLLREAAVRNIGQWAEA